MPRTRRVRVQDTVVDLVLVPDAPKAKKPKAKRKPAPLKPPATPKVLLWLPVPPLPVCALDPSLTNTAGHFGLVDGAHMDALHYQKLSRFSIQTDMATCSHRLHRLNTMRSAFLHEIDGVTRKYGPGLLVVEAYAYSRLMGKVSERYEWGGQLRMSAYSMGWDVVEVPPNVLKYWLTGYGAAKKPQMMDAVEKRFGYKSKDDNDADAFALSQLGSAFIRWRLGATVSQDEEAQFARLEVWEAMHGR